MTDHEKLMKELVWRAGDAEPQHSGERPAQAKERAVSSRRSDFRTRTSASNERPDTNRTSTASLARHCIEEYAILLANFSFGPLGCAVRPQSRTQGQAASWPEAFGISQSMSRRAA